MKRFAPTDQMPPAVADAQTGWRFGEASALRRQLARPPRAWLSEREQESLERWRHPERRRSWLLARIVAKRLIRQMLRDHGDAAVESRAPTDAADVPANAVAQAVEGHERPLLFRPSPRLAEIEVLATGGVGRPSVWLRGARLPWSISIAHDEASVFVAASSSARHFVGVDLTSTQGPDAATIRLWCTAAERDWLLRLDAARTARAAAFIWAAKESLFKAIGGQGFDPRRIEILPDVWRYDEQTMPPLVRRCWAKRSQLALLIWLPAIYSKKVHL